MESTPKIHPEVYYICAHPDHKGSMEIFKGASLSRVMETDSRYEIIGEAASREDAIAFTVSTVKEAIKKDPELTDLKEDIRRMYHA
ncbi:MAG: hypothetical protein II795_06140 [Firmicutes bacterium]|nr:hypothetical protein [Bacillota bacterium]MBQ5960956.1 hypothetical protein [Bacillota bacterium]